MIQISDERTYDERSALELRNTSHHSQNLTIILTDAWLPEQWDERLRNWSPKTELGQFVRSAVLEHLPPEVAAELIERFSSVVILHSQIRGRHYVSERDLWENHGVLSRKVITTAGVGFLVDAWQNILELEIMKYHGVGTGTNSESSSDTALQTESTTILNPDSTRATGSLTEGASANIFRTVGTPSFDGSGAITEHMLFSQAATGGGTGWDRSVFSALNVASGDSIQFTYDLTCSAGG